MATVHANGIDIYHEVHGSGPPLLVITGTGHDLRNIAVDESPYNAHFTAIHFDQRGLGRTSQPQLDYSMADYADDAAALVRSLGYDSCHVIGTSFGGMVALNLVVRHPNTVRRLVLCCTSPGGAYPSYPLHEVFDMEHTKRVETQMRLLDERWDPAANEPIPGIGSAYLTMLASIEEPATSEPGHGLLRQLLARKDHDVVADLGSIEAKTLICAGRHDLTAPMANSEYLAEELANATLSKFEGGHLFTQQDPTAIPQILEFLTR